MGSITHGAVAIRSRITGPRLRAGTFFAGPLLAVVLCTAPAHAQDPPDLPVPGDTAADTIASDTLAADSLAADSTEEAVQRLVSFERATETDWAAGTWVWDEEALMANGAYTLADLLEQVPGVMAVRAGYYGMPQAVSAFGATGSRIELVIDGFALDPLGESTFDLSRLELNQLRHVRLERRPGGIRVEVLTRSPTDPRPYTLIQAGTGDPVNAELFRGLFMSPRVLGGPFAAGVERLNSRTPRQGEQTGAFAGWLKWGLVNGNTGVQLEFRRHRLQRSGQVGTPVTGMRQDWIVRARAEPKPDLTTETFIGVSSVEDEADAPAGDVAGEEAARVANLQSGVRTQYRGERGWVRGGLRVRTHPGLPRAEMNVAGVARVLDRLRIRGRARAGQWHNGERTGSFSVGSQLDLFGGLRAFADIGSGRRGVRFLAADSGAADPVFTRRTTARVGADVSYGRLRLGAAAVGVRTDSVPSFGLPFDRQIGTVRGGTVGGWEARAHVPLLWEPLSLEASYQHWPIGRPWIYLPERSGQASLAYHQQPLDSDDLEIYARLTGRHRGAMRVPAVTDAGLSIVPAQTMVDFYLQIRVLQVRAFLRWENLTHRLTLHDLPGRFLPGQRLLYGIKWEFWN